MNTPWGNVGGGGWELIDRYGRGYYAVEVGYGPPLPSLFPMIAFTQQTGYVYPPMAIRDAASVTEAIQNGRIVWTHTFSTDPLGGNAIGVTSASGPYDWGKQGWAYLDGQPAETVVQSPDNGCDCGA